MHVSDEMLRKMVQVYRDSIGGIEESFAAVLAVLPEMYTVEQVCEMYGSWILSNEKDACMTFPEYISPRLTQQTPAAPQAQATPEMYTLEQVEAAMHNFLRARFAMPDKHDRQSNIDDFIARLTQQTPAAQLVGAEVNGDLLYDSEQATQDAEPTITLAEHKAKMRELLEELMPMSDGLAYKEKLYRKYGLTEPTPEERVTIKDADDSWFVYLDGVYQYNGKESTAKALHYGLIAQLKKEEK